MPLVPEPADEDEPPGEEREDDPPLGSLCRASAAAPAASTALVSFSFALESPRAFPSLELMVGFEWHGENALAHLTFLLESPGPQTRSGPSAHWRLPPDTYYNRPTISAKLSYSK